MLKNLELKVLSVLIAISLWFVVLNSDIIQMKLYVPISLENIHKGYIAVTDAKLLNIEVKGSNLLLKNISHKDIVVSIDISNFKEGKTKYKIKFDDIKTPKGIDVVKIEPEYINIQIDKLITKDLTVVPTFIGEPKLGFKVETVRSYPDKVKVTGAESKLKDIDFIETLPINLSEKSESVIYAIGMKTQDGINTIKPEQIDVFISFKEDIVEEKYENYQIEIINKNNDFKYKITPITVELKVKGRKDRVIEQNIKKYIKLYIDLSTINSTGVFLREINKVIDDRIKIISIKPKRVRVEVNK